MWIPLRSAKMNGFIFGFQRRVWWPKWTPASSSWRMETDGTVRDLLSVLSSADLVAGGRWAVGPAGTVPVGTVRVCAPRLSWRGRWSGGSGSCPGPGGSVARVAVRGRALADA